MGNPYVGTRAMGVGLPSRVTVVLPPSLEELLRRYAADHGVDVESVVGEAVRQFLREQANGRTPPRQDRYPLRGSVLRFDDPLEPAAPESEWGEPG